MVRVASAFIVPEIPQHVLSNSLYELTGAFPRVIIVHRHTCVSRDALGFPAVSVYSRMLVTGALAYHFSHPCNMYSA